MGEVERIADQLRRAYAGNAWHGPGIREVLEGVSAKTAAARPLAGAHTIWELVLHVTAWTEAVRRRLDGDPANLGPEEDWPPAGEASERAWKSVLDRLEKAQLALEQRVAESTGTGLDEPILAGASSVYVTLHGLIQHDLYHAGQMALLKKAAERPLAE